MQTVIARFISDESGATAIEYGLIAALIGASIILSMQGLRDAIISTFGTAGTTMTSAN